MSGFRRLGGRVVYENPWLRFEAHDIIHPNGTRGEHGLVVPPEAVGVVVLDGDDVLLVRQARFAIDASVIEVVKGGAHAGEAALAAAKRELREELGRIATRWEPLGAAHEIPSVVSVCVNLFLARDLTSTATDFEAVESIEPVRMPFADALHAAATGALTDAISVVALFRAAYALGITPAAPSPDSTDVRADRARD
jgi:8-oxo-dGTP pyrophosphatase MutT (NUDIX family)